MLRIFVRIGALKRFHALKEKTKDLPVTIDWDRRRGERRQENGSARHGRRSGDRRAAPPFTWDVADFVVVEDPTEKDEP